MVLVTRASGMLFVVAAPSSTINLGTPTRKYIPVELRSASEALEFDGTR